MWSEFKRRGREGGQWAPKQSDSFAFSSLLWILACLPNENETASPVKQNMGNDHSQMCFRINDIYNVSFPHFSKAFWNNVSWSMSVCWRLICLPGSLLLLQTPPSEAIHSIRNTTFSCFACKTSDGGKYFISLQLHQIVCTFSHSFGFFLKLFFSTSMPRCHNW